MKMLLLIGLLTNSIYAFAQLNEAQFHEEVANFISHSGGLTDAYNKNKRPLKIQEMWEATPETYSRGAGIHSEDDGTWVVELTGYVARAPLSTPDTLDFVMCHEIGHVNTMDYPGYDNEAKADDFAARTCLRYVWGDGYSSARVKATTTYSWELRNSAHQGKFDPDHCTTRNIENAADGLPYVKGCQD
jgi:hypothetical protein